MTQEQKLEAEYLLTRYIQGIISSTEEGRLDTLLAAGTDQAEWESIVEELMAAEPQSDYRPEKWQPVLNAILGQEYKPPAKVRALRPLRRAGIAAAVLLLLSIGAYLAFFQKPSGRTLADTPVAIPLQNDVAPGKDGAILTLADGKTILLENASNGKLTEDAIKSGNQLSYQNTSSKEVEYNTMSTPRGRQYSLVLADGTRVWLNAGSSIHFPTAFVEKERRVEITGEAYFEVARDASKPFHVAVNGMDVRVLGTHFNINAYSDEESIKTTLLEGSVQVSNGARQVVIKPGEQASFSGGNSGLVNVRSGVDIDAVIAWKNGFFSFNNSDLPTVMRQIARWFDVEVVYEGTVPTRRFGGEISRNLNASQVLKILEESKVRFRIEGRRIIVQS
ncbi:MAG TPA: FecR domain-containing protein [Flavisolibacter sp.]|nr:FecR domain-containing protein [Flavisolibacter sp.]